MSTITRKDKIKLVYAYVITPILMCLQIGGQVMSELNGKYDYDAALNAANRTGFVLGLIGYFLLIFPPTVLRFVFFRRELDYGEELYSSAMFSLAVTMLMMYLFTWTAAGAGLLGSLAVYCVLSYGAKKANMMSRMLRYTLTLATLAAPFLIAYMHHCINPNAQPVFFPLWEAIVLSIILNSQISELKAETASENIGTQKQPNASPRAEESKSQESEETPAQKLVAVGLAAIGRKTKRFNKYMTNERIETRRKAEYPFLKLLAEKYSDERHRKKLSKHFMLFKEMCLFIAYGAILRDNPQMHEEVKMELTRLLSKGLMEQVLEWRNEYWRLLTKNFYDNYQRTNQIGEALSNSFWGTLTEKYPEVEKEAEKEKHSDILLLELFRNVYRDIERSQG